MPLRIEPPLFRRRADWFRQTRAFTIDKAVREPASWPACRSRKASAARRSGIASTGTSASHVRHRGRLRVPTGPDHAAPGPRGDGEDDRAPRARPGRHLPGRAHRARRAAAQDHRPVTRGLPACPERGRHDPARLQRRDLQSRAPPEGARGARPPLPGPLRLRNGGARLRGVGPRCVERFRGFFAFALWTASAASSCWPATGSGSSRLLRVVGGPPGLRFRDQGDPRAPGRPAGDGRPVHVPLPRLRVRAGAGHDVPGDSEAAARDLARSAGSSRSSPTGSSGSRTRPTTRPPWPVACARRSGTPCTRG